MAPQDESFGVLKDALFNPPVRKFLQDDVPFILDTDTSDVGVGAVFSQVQDDCE